MGDTLRAGADAGGRIDEARRVHLGGGGTMLFALGVVLLVMWLLGFVVFHVASGLIHLLLILAVISVIVHLVRGRRQTV
jgi:hypothetical protein